VRQATQRAEQTVPVKRPGRLREVGLLALYLASAASDYMTGQTILLDGGLSLQQERRLTIGFSRTHWSATREDIAR
jgi:NAD(P)-dependent dehydrogenase (short-subunit alcohol dehydrogenase family)